MNDETKLAVNRLRTKMTGDYCNRAYMEGCLLKDDEPWLISDLILVLDELDRITQVPDPSNASQTPDTASRAEPQSLRFNKHMQDSRR